MIAVALKSLLGRKLRLLLSTFAIVLGVAFVSGTFIFTDTLQRSFTAIFASAFGDVVVRPVNELADQGAASNVTIPATLVDRLAKVDGAARADGNVAAIGVYTVGSDGKVVGGQGAPAFGFNFSDAPAGHGIESLSIVRGDEPSTSGEVALDRVTAERAGYDLGDTVRLVNAVGDQSTLTATLVGVADYAEGGSLNGASMAIFDTATAQDLFLEGENAFSDIWVTASDGVSQNELRDRVATDLPAGLEAVTGDAAADEAGGSLLEAISFITTFLLIFAGISLVVGSYLIINTFSILVAQRSRELALLRALGASRRQVMRSVMIEAFALGVLGSTLGLLMGFGLAVGLKALFAVFGLDLSGTALVFQPRTALAAYGVGITVTMVAAYFPARRTGHISPVEAMGDSVAMSEPSMRRRWLIGSLVTLAGIAAMAVGLIGDVPRAGWIVGGGVLAVLLGVTALSPTLSRPYLLLAGGFYARFFGPVGALAGQNSLRQPRRTAATASALMIGLALACTMAIIGDSAKSSIDKTIADNFVGDFVVNNAIGQGFSTQVGNRMEKVDGVEAVIRERIAGAQYDGSMDGPGEHRSHGPRRSRAEAHRR